MVNENQVIITEDLNIKGMVRNHKLAKAISDCGWGMFLNFLDYKCKQDGKVFLEIDRFFPSSKTCNHCLNVVDSLPLDIRSWDCPSCGTKNIDRDINAALNIRDEGLRISFSSGTGETANGGSVRPRRGRKSTVLDAVAHGGNHGAYEPARQPRRTAPPQDRSASLVATADEVGSPHSIR